MAMQHTELSRDVVEWNGFLHLLSDLGEEPRRRRTQSDFDVDYLGQSDCGDASTDAATTDGQSTESDEDSDEDVESVALVSDTEPTPAPASLLHHTSHISSVPVQHCLFLAVARPACCSGQASGEMTTVMIRNIPNNISRNRLAELFSTSGFHGSYDFLYLPYDFDSGANLGYAFVNLINGSEAMRFVTTFRGFRAWPGQSTSKKVTDVQWSRDHQGLEAQVERYRNTSLMHESVPEECRPMLLRDGMQVPFPAPTRPVRPPNWRSKAPKRRSKQ